MSATGSTSAAAARLLAEQALELPQKDELCGAFWGLVSLRAAGVRTGPDGQALDQDAVAVAAGSRLSPPPRPNSRPPGERIRDDYRLALPVDAEDPGTSAAGVSQAIRELSAGDLAVIPVTGEWQVENLLALLESVWKQSIAPVAVIANLHTSRLWPANVSDERYARYLLTGDHGGLISDWSVGHFVALVGLSRGDHGTLVDVADSYPSRGNRGRHRQPVERIVASLRSVAGRTRGLLLVVAAASEHEGRELGAAAGLEPRLWDSRGGQRRAG